MKVVPNFPDLLQEFSQSFLKSSAIFCGLKSIYVFME
jgi:hypothetical protein